MNRRGAALVVVLWVILVLSLLVGGFAFTMHVETQVASFGRKELKAELLARSGVEVARMQLLLDLRSPSDGAYDARNQLWATNELLYVNHELGDGKYTVTITDEESKLPLNRMSAEQLSRLLALLGVDPVDADVIVDSILDWTDDNDLHRLNGAEDDYYLSLDPPYRCKDGPFDRVEELLLVRGMTPELFYGSAAAEPEAEPGRPTLRDVLTTTSSGQVNVNTASGLVLRAWLGLDENQVAAVLERRDGPDGLPGTEDDQPFATVGEFLRMLGPIEDSVRNQAEQLLTVNSRFFTVESVGEVGGVQRVVRAILARENDTVIIVQWQQQRRGWS